MEDIPADLLSRAEAGDANAQFDVAIHYQLGRGVPQDYDTAMKWCLRAAEQGHARAQFNIGSFHFHGLCVQADPKEAMRWYELAARNGDPELLYSIGHLVEKQHEALNAWPFAVRCYKAAADAGHAEAQCTLGTKLFLGQGIEQDVDRGLEYLYKAADQHHVDSFILLGHIHAEGHLGEPDRAKGLCFLRMASKQGHSQATQWADDLYAKMSPEERVRAEELLEQSAESARRGEREQ